MPASRRTFLILCAAAVLAVRAEGEAGSGTAGAGTGFVSGAICAEARFNSSIPSSDILRGKHLRIGELWWGPWAIPDEEAPYGFTGANMDQYKMLSELLGFTYEVVDIGYPLEGETWTTMLPRAAKTVDLVGSFWINNDQRANTNILVRGQYDMSTVLVAKMVGAAENKQDNWYKSFYSFLDPFTYELWGAILAVIILSGVVDYLVEVKKVRQTTLIASLYEYCAGFLWGGFEYPLSKSSMAYQIILGFFVLVLISAYTANLAAFITVSAVPVQSVTSMDDAIINRKALCASEGGYLPRVRAMYPRVRWGPTSKNQYEPANRLATRDGCDGLVTFNMDYKAWRTDEAYCELELAQVISPGLGGWATDKESACVAEAMAYGLMKLDSNGYLELLINSYLPQMPCSKTRPPWTQPPPPPPARRSLADLRNAEDYAEYFGESLSGMKLHGMMSWEEWWGTSDSSSTRGGGGGRAHDTRRLKGIGGDGAASEGGSDGGAVPKMDLLDFVGFFCLWGVVSIFFLFINYAPACCLAPCTAAYRCCTPPLGSVGRKLQRTANKDKDKGKSALDNVGEDEMGELGGVDNEAGLLRKLLAQMSHVQAELAELKSGDTQTAEIKAEIKMLNEMMMRTQGKPPSGSSPASPTPLVNQVAFQPTYDRPASAESADEAVEQISAIQKLAAARSRRLGKKASALPAKASVATVSSLPGAMPPAKLKPSLSMDFFPPSEPIPGELGVVVGKEVDV